MHHFILSLIFQIKKNQHTFHKETNKIDIIIYNRIHLKINRIIPIKKFRFNFLKYYSKYYFTKKSSAFFSGISITGLPVSKIAPLALRLF